jgi:hypothetical protein
MRKGNAEQYEHAFQVGFNGLQLRSEGPISEKPNSSYLVSYRYSTLAVMDALGFSFGDLQGVPEFQDIAFKVQSQLGPGVLSVFGIGGISNIDILESELSAQAWDDLETPYFRDVRSEARMGVGGASYKLPVGEEGLLALTVGLSEESRHNDVDTLSLDQEPRPLYDEHYSSWDAQAHLQYTHKFGARHNLRAGVHVRQAMLDMQDSLWLYGPTPARQVSLHNIEESYTLTQAYAQWQSRITQGLTATAGLRGMHLSIDGQRSLSPRAGLQWQAARRHTFSAGYGLHHQMQPVPVYYTLDSEGNTPNASLDFTRSQHAILGYDFRPSADWRLRVESYYQWLDQVPVRATPSAYALLNSGANFNRLPDYTDLENEGTGRNLGLELTVEKFLAQGWYALLTGSLFDARYTASDGEQHPTAFDKGYATNLLLGTEQPVGPKQANQIFGDVRAVTSGGFRYTPVDKQASQAAGRPIYQEAPFAGQMRPYFRLDVKLGYRQNFAQISQEFSLTLQNVTNHQNIFTRDYDPRTNSIIERNQLGFFPVMRYKLLF